MGEDEGGDVGWRCKLEESSLILRCVPGYPAGLFGIGRCYQHIATGVLGITSPVEYNFGFHEMLL